MIEEVLQRQARVLLERGGCQWNRFPEEFPDDSSVHRAFQRRVELGILNPIRASLLEECEEFKGVEWEWQAAEGLWAWHIWAARGTEPHRSSQTSVKRSLLVEDDGGALAMIVAPANVRDDKVLEATLDAVVVESPEPTEEAPQHLCLAKGYDKQPTRELVQGRACFPHIRRIGEEKLDEDG